MSAKSRVVYVNPGPIMQASILSRVPGPHDEPEVAEHQNNRDHMHRRNISVRTSTVLCFGGLVI